MAHTILRLAVRLACATIVATATAYAAPEPSAQALFAKAEQQAQKQHKHILVVFSASWCAPCKLFEHFLDDPQMKAVTEKAFVVLPIDIGEEFVTSHTRPSTPGAMELRESFGIHGGLDLPFFIMTNADGKQIVNSDRNGKPGANIGYPAVGEEIGWYLEMLKQAAPNLSAADLDATRKWLEDHSPDAPLVHTKLKQ